MKLRLIPRFNGVGVSLDNWDTNVIYKVLRGTYPK